MSVRSKYSVDQMSEGEILVRGTRDPLQAIRIAFDLPYPGYRLDDALLGVARPRPGIDTYVVDPERVREFGDQLHTMLQSARPGYYRKVHCLDNSYGSWEGWGWALHPADGPGRGAFEAVEFP